MGKGSFILYDDDLKYAERLTDSQKADLFTALLKHRFHGEYTDFEDDLPVFMLYNRIIDHVSANEAKYKEICEKRSESIKKRWHSEKKSTDKYSAPYNCIQEDTIVSDNDNDNVNDNVNVYDNDKDNVACGAKKKTKENNYYNKKNNIPKLLQDDPAYDIEAFERKAIGLKYQKKDNIHI